LQCYYAVYEKSDINNDAFNRCFSNGTNQRRKLLEKLGLTTAQIQEVELLIEETCNAVFAPLEEKLKNCLNAVFSQNERQKPVILIPWLEEFQARWFIGRRIESSYLNWIENMVKKFQMNFNYRLFQFDRSIPNYSLYFNEVRDRDYFAAIEAYLIFYGSGLYRLSRIAMSDEIIPPHVILNDDVNGDRDLGQFLNAECPSIIITTGG
jgi:hypothetical protein